MKVLTIILLVFILCLTLTPCSDCFNSEHQQIQSITDRDTYEHSEDTDDSCPPICICACCGVTIVYESFQELSIDSRTVVIVKADSVDHSEYTFYFFSSIWQPPQSIS